MENRKTFTYNGVNSADYGLYISGDSVYNAPSRVYEMVDIAGRNGQLAIDQGRFENIEVTYPAFIFAETQTEFAQRLRDIRAWLMSPVGYQRLEDTYHPDEFRLGIYKSGLEVEPIFYNKAGRFELIFDCKPQRFLFSGEETFVLGEWGETETVSGSIATFEAESNTGIKSLIANIEPIQSGTGDPSPDNVRPISGWDGVEVWNTGKNFVLFPYASASGTYCGIQVTMQDDGGIKLNGTCTSSSWIRLATLKLKAGTYTLSPSRLADCNLITQKNGAYWFGGGVNGGVTKTLDETATIIISLAITSGKTYNGTVYPQFELGSSVTSFEIGQGENITKALGQTVYGGTLNLISGELTITKQIFNVDFRGRTGTGQSGKYGWYSAVVPNIIKPAFTEYPTGMLCNRLAVGTRNESYNALKDCVSIHQTEGRIYTYVESLSAMTLAEAQAWLAENPIQVVYPLQTPEVIQLTPETIQTILGVNNIWADTGEVSVEIGEDPNILVNPTPFEALPIFEVVGTGSLTVGNITIDITGDSTQDIFIDSDIMESYEDDNGAIISRNDRINLSGTDFPKLGEETRVESNGLTSVKITPRWWTI